MVSRLPGCMSYCLLRRESVTRQHSRGTFREETDSSRAHRVVRVFEGLSIVADSLKRPLTLAAPTQLSKYCGISNKSDAGQIKPQNHESMPHSWVTVIPPPESARLAPQASLLACKGGGRRKLNYFGEIRS